MYNGWTKDEPQVRPATIQQMRESIKNILELEELERGQGWKEAAQALDNAIELMEIAHKRYNLSKDNETTDEPTQEEITTALWDVNMDTPARVRFSFPVLCQAMDEYEANNKSIPSWMRQAYNDMRTLPADPATASDYVVRLVQYV